jgi:hypothetical protein
LSCDSSRITASALKASRLASSGQSFRFSSSNPGKTFATTCNSNNEHTTVVWHNLLAAHWKNNYVHLAVQDHCSTNNILLAVAFCSPDRIQEKNPFDDEQSQIAERKTVGEQGPGDHGKEAAEQKGPRPITGREHVSGGSRGKSPISFLQNKDIM